MYNLFASPVKNLPPDHTHTNLRVQVFGKNHLRFVWHPPQLQPGSIMDYIKLQVAMDRLKSSRSPLVFQLAPVSFELELSLTWQGHVHECLSCIKLQEAFTNCLHMATNLKPCQAAPKVMCSVTLWPVSFFFLSAEFQNATTYTIHQYFAPTKYTATVSDHHPTD